MDANREVGGTGDRKPHRQLNRQLIWAIALGAPVLLIPLIVSVCPARPLRWQSATGVLLLILIGTVTWTDARSFRIPNWITYPGVLWGLTINGISEFVSPETAQKLGAVGMFDSFVGGLLPFIAMLVIFSMTGGGAGDVKLVAAIGVFLGLSLAVDSILCSFIFAGGFALIRAVWHEGPVKMVATITRSAGHFLVPTYIAPPSEADRMMLRSPMPLAPSFALGTAMILFELVPGEYFV